MRPRGGGGEEGRGGGKKGRFRFSGPPPWMHHGRRHRGLKGLQGRLLLWFLVAIMLAVGASVFTTILTSNNDSEYPTRIVSRHMQQRVAKLWDDPAATDAYIAQLRDTTGLDIRVRRDPEVFPPGPRMRNEGMFFDEGNAFIPVVKKGQVVGALELRAAGPRPQAWRVIAAIVAALFVLGGVARRVSMHLARPLEHVAATAEKFGSGDLAARTGVEKLPRRWVAEEVRELGRAFDNMADRISRVVLEQRELLAAISHELRSPLGRARIAVEIARERNEEAESKGTSGGTGSTNAAPIGRSLNEVEKQLVEMDAILGDLLASARAGLADLRREPMDVVSWVQDRIDQEMSDSEAPAISLIAHRLPEKNREAEIDPALLGRALHNLFANAWAHGHAKEVPLVVTMTTGTADSIRIAVRDRGPGFSAEILPRAFDPFVTGTGAARSPGSHGIGLGLSLVRRIVEAHGGTVSAENVEENGKVTGAIVAIELPLGAAQAPLTTTSKSCAPSTSAANEAAPPMSGTPKEKTA